MKNYLKILFMGLFVMALTACQKEEFKPDDMVGKWHVLGTQEYYRYTSNGKGKFWNEADDVHESDITEGGNGSFSWELKNTKLTLLFNNEMGTAVIPKNYTVTTLNSVDLIYFEVNTAGGKETYRLRRVE